MQFHLTGNFKPYVRMTQRSKFVNPQAIAYLDSKMALARQFRQQCTDIPAFPAKTPLKVYIMILHPASFHNRDLDNEIKATLDAAQGIVFHNDCWVDSIQAQRQISDRVSVTTMTVFIEKLQE